MPPVPLPRRRLESAHAAFHAPIRIGDRLQRISELTEISVEDDGAGPGARAQVPPVPGTSVWSRRIVPDPVTLFRLSAVRFNAHRVHYDRDYATEAEGMPGLSVPITLVSSQMMEMLRAKRPDHSLASFSYRSIRRIFDRGAYTVHGAPQGEKVVLWARDHEGALAVLAGAALVRDGGPKRRIIATGDRARAGA